MHPCLRRTSRIPSVLPGLRDGVVRSEQDSVPADRLDDVGDAPLPERADPDVAPEHVVRMLGEILRHLPVQVFEVTEQRVDPRTAVLDTGDAQSWEAGQRAVADETGDHVGDFAVAQHHPPECALRHEVLGIRRLPLRDVVVERGIAGVQHDRRACGLDIPPERIELRKCW